MGAPTGSCRLKEAQGDLAAGGHELSVPSAVGDALGLILFAIGEEMALLCLKAVG